MSKSIKGAMGIPVTLSESDKVADFKNENIWDEKEAYRRVKVLKKNYNLLRQEVEYQYNIGENFMRPLISLKLAQSKKIHPVYQQEVTVRLIGRAKKLIKSRLVGDRLEVDFKTRSHTRASRKIASQLKYAALGDQRAMPNFDSMRDDLIDNIADFGLGILLLQKYDGNSLLPIPFRVNPLYTIPDPTNIDPETAQFWGYHTLTNLGALRNNKDYFNIEELEVGIKSDMMERIKDTKIKNQQGGIELSHSSSVEVYTHYIRYRGHLYVTVWANNRNTLIYIKEISPVTDIEKKNLASITIPVAFYRMWRIEGHYFGESLPDLLEADQDTASMLKRLQIISARRLAYGPDTIYNSKFLNARQMATKQIGGNLFAYESDSDEPVLPNQVMSHVQENTPSAFVGNQEEEIVRNAERNIGLGSASQQGMSQRGNQTKAEIQEQSRSIDTTFEYINTLIMRGEIRFWTLWLRAHRLNLKHIAKNLVLPDTEDTLSNLLEKKDLAEDICEIVIVSKGELEMEKRSRFAQKQIVGANLMATKEPGSPSFLYLMRTSLEDSGGYTESEIKKAVPYSKEEKVAHEIVEITEAGIEYPLSNFRGYRIDWILEALLDSREHKELNKVRGALEGMLLTQQEAQEAQQQEMQQEEAQTGDKNAQNQLMNQLIQEQV